MNKIIEVDSFAKSYGSVQAVKDISFYVEEGKLFSFLGPNGAGKSTTIDTLCTLLDYDAGSIVIDGYDLLKNAQAVRQSIGVVFQDSILDNLLTVRENLLIRAGLYDIKGAAAKNKVNELIEIIGLKDFSGRLYGKLSGGQRRRTDIAAALLHQPKILFLDEPTTGLDPQTRMVIWETIKNLQAQSGMTVFLTTHYMEEAAESDYIVVIDHGEIAAKGTPAEIKTKYASDSLRITPINKERLREQLDEMWIKFTAANGVFDIKLSDTMESLPILEKCKQNIAGFQVIQGTMDDAFIGITGKEIR